MFHLATNAKFTSANCRHKQISERDLNYGISSNQRSFINKLHDWSSRRSEAKASGWLQSAVTTTHVLSMHSAFMLRKFYFSSSSVVSRAFSTHAHAMHVLDIQASSSFPRLPLCQILFLLCPPLLS